MNFRKAAITLAVVFFVSLGLFNISVADSAEETVPQKAGVSVVDAATGEVYVSLIVDSAATQAEINEMIQHKFLEERETY